MNSQIVAELDAKRSKELYLQKGSVKRRGNPWHYNIGCVRSKLISINFLQCAALSPQLVLEVPPEFPMRNSAGRINILSK